MFGLCLPRGETILLLKDGTKKSIEFSDEVNPRKYIMNDKYVLGWIKKLGYKNVEAIQYSIDGKDTVVSMVDYYAENGKELED